MKKFSSVLIASLMLFAAGCNPNTEAPAESKYEVWSTYNTMRVVQNPSLNGNYEKWPAKITAQMAKHEMESAQLFITTDENTQIKNYSLVAQDLVNENGDVFSADNIDVYAQYYVDVRESTHGTNIEEYPVGYMPDGLIPMEVSADYGENTIGKNCNQGITVDFTARKDTPAGIYTGSFKLIVDEKEVEIQNALIAEMNGAPRTVMQL